MAKRDGSKTEAPEETEGQEDKNPSLPRRTVRFLKRVVQPFIKEVVQPFINMVKAPRVIWGINLPNFLEGIAYWGFLGYLTKHFSEFILVSLGPTQADISSHHMVMFLTAGITLSLFFLGGTADKVGVRRSLLISFVFLAIGRVIVSAAPTLLGMEPGGLWSTLNMTTMLGLLFVVIGYGMFQPAIYTGVKKFSKDPKSAAMGYAMIYALMNLGGYLPSFAFLLRNDEYAGFGITGVFWVYTGITAVSLVSVLVILTRRVEQRAITEAEKASANSGAESDGDGEEPATADRGPSTSVPQEEELVGRFKWFRRLLRWFWRSKLGNWMRNHPMANPQFTFFIFILMPTRTLYAYNWLVLPQYISRSYPGWIGENFEFASNMNPLMIFVLTPIIVNFTSKMKAYNMMIVGTLIMAMGAILPALATNAVCLFGYLVIMTIGEAVSSPRFLQFAAEIAPEGRTGEYMGVANLPWFLTKVLVPLYSGHLIANLCPVEGSGLQGAPTILWQITVVICFVTPLCLFIFRRWAMKGLQERADD